MLEGYPYIFQMNDKMYSDEYLEYTLQYRFKSEKSHHTYIVRVEKYIDHAYCVKFFDKANMLSDNKFSLRTNTFEPRRIISTVFNIMLDVLKKDEKASFFFLGAEDENAYVVVFLHKSCGLNADSLKSALMEHGHHQHQVFLFLIH